MKNIVRLSVAFVVVSCFATILGYSTKTPVVLTSGPDAQQLMQVERELGAAFNRLDTKTIDHLLAKEASITGVRGRRATKAEALAEIKSPAASLPAHDVSLDYEEIQARIYGEIGILTGVAIWKKGDTLSDRWSFTDTFVKRDGRWQVVAFHRTRVAKD